MAATILATKLYIPPLRAKTVPRSRLIERLNEGLTGKLSLISAPAGFGKTSLISEWVHGCHLPAAWISLDEGDSDPARFIAYLTAALQKIKTGFGERILDALQSPQPLPSESLLPALLNEITTISDHFILILDDFHSVDSQAVVQTLAFLLDHLPPQMHVVIATREDPSLPLSRLRARAELTELRSSDLRFTPAEATEFLNQVMSLDLSVENIAALETGTEGWIAGLQLAALALQCQVTQSHSEAGGFIQSFTGSHRFVLDYLVEEVLQHQTVEVQAFLLRTSILGRLCGQLCDAVLLSPAGSSQKALEDLEHANLFIVPLDNERRWYRYHQLFGDLLHQRLGQSLSPSEITELHHRASPWYEKNGDEAEAFRHAFAAGDYGRAAGLAELAWQGMEESFRSAAWLGWVKKLPDDVIRMRPVLSTQMAQAFIDAGEPAASEDCLQEAERSLNGSSDRMVVADEAQLGALPAVIAMTRAYNAQVQGNLSDTVKYAELALQYIPEGDLFRRAQATITLEMTHWARGDLEAARSALVDWMDSMQKAGNFAFVVASAFALADILVAQGRLREAVETNQQAIQLAAEHGKDAQQITAHHYLGLAMIRHEMGEDATAPEYLQKAKEMGEQTTLVDWSYRWHTALARLKEAEGALGAALILLDEARHAYVKTLIPDIRPIEALKANVYLKQGHLDKAQDWVVKRGLSAKDETSYLNEFEHLVLARVLIAEYQSQRSNDSVLQAIGLLERLLKAAEAQKRTGSVIEILLAQALAHQAQGNLPLALASLERALTLAAPEGYFRLFVDAGEPVHLLLLDFRARLEKPSSGQSHPLHIYVAKLLAAFATPVDKLSTTPALAAGATMKSPKVEMIELLSERELEVLKLLRTELSGPEIAGELVISPNTFRTHTKNIFSKLGVNNRRAAVRRAEELDLF